MALTDPQSLMLSSQAQNGERMSARRLLGAEGHRDLSGDTWDVRQSASEGILASTAKAVSFQILPW